MFEVEAHVVRDAMAVYTVVTVMHESWVRLVGIVQLELAVISFSCIAQSHQVTYPRLKVFKHFHTILVDPATATEREEFRKSANDPRNLLFKFVDWLDSALFDAKWCWLRRILRFLTLNIVLDIADLLERFLAESSCRRRRRDAVGGFVLISRVEKFLLGGSVDVFNAFTRSMVRNTHNFVFFVVLWLVIGGIDGTGT